MSSLARTLLRCLLMALLFAVAPSVASASDGLLILTTDDVVCDSAALAQYIEHKKHLGFRVDLRTPDAWNGGKPLRGDPAANKVRDYLQSVYKSYKYLLIIADPTPEPFGMSGERGGELPMKMTYVPRKVEGGKVISYKEGPTDAYYADLTGNWDLNSNGRYGESPYKGYRSDFGPGGIDGRRELAVGRIPYYGVITDLDKILRKIIDYESATDVGGWVQRILLPMVPGNAKSPMYDLGEAIRKDIAKPCSYGVYRLYADYYDIEPRPEWVPCSVGDLRDEWRNGYGFVFWSTHGGPTGARSIMSSSTASALDDTKPAFVYEASCHNAWPEKPNNLAYSLLKNGAIATVAYTRMSGYGFGKNRHRDKKGAINQVMCYRYAVQLAKHRRRCGDAFNAMQASLKPAQGWSNQTLANLYGDPTVAPRWPTCFAIQTDVLPTGQIGRYYEFDLAACGGQAPYEWSLANGEVLPPGLSLRCYGCIAGIPTELGSHGVVLKARDKTGAEVERSFALSIAEPVGVATAELPPVVVGQHYEVQLMASGGEEPYRWLVYAGKLPAGLKLSRDGCLSGAIAKPGNWSFTLRAIDRCNSPAEASCKLSAGGF